MVASKSATKRKGKDERTLPPLRTFYLVLLLSDEQKMEGSCDSARLLANKVQYLLPDCLTTRTVL